MLFRILWTDITTNETLTAISTTISGFFSDAWTAVDTAWKGAGDYFSNLWTGLTTNETLTTIGTTISGFVNSAWEGITSFFESAGIAEWFTKNVWDKITGVFSGVKEWFTTMAGDIWDGLTGGLESTVENVKTKVTGFFENVWGGVLNFFGIKSPSTLAASAGKNLLDGFSKGAEIGRAHV